MHQVPQVVQRELREMFGEVECLGDPTRPPAYLYGRTSHAIQTEEGRTSIGRQLTTAVEMSRKHGRSIPLDMIYYDVGTGENLDERPMILALLEEIRSNARSDVVFADTDIRVSRDPADFGHIIRTLKRFNVQLIVLEEKDEALRWFVQLLGKYELTFKRHRLEMANIVKAKKGSITAKRPAFGYRIEEKDGKRVYVVYEPEARWVRQIYNWYAVDGLSLGAIAARLTGTIPTPLGKRIWSIATIRSMIKREVYRGEYIARRIKQEKVYEKGRLVVKESWRPESEWISFPISPIVSPEIWYAANARLAENKKRSRRNAQYDYLCQGLIRCAICQSKGQKSKFNVYAKRRKGKVVARYYRCNHAYHKIKELECRSRQLPTDWFDDLVRQVVDDFLLDEELLIRHLEERHHTHERSLFEERIRDYQLALERLDQKERKLIAAYLDNETEVFHEFRDAIQSQRQRIQQRLQEAREAIKTMQDLDSKRLMVQQAISHLRQKGGFKTLPFDDQRSIVLNLIDEILVNTREGWFELRGVLRGTYHYDEESNPPPSGDDGQQADETCSHRRSGHPHHIPLSCGRPSPPSCLCALRPSLYPSAEPSPGVPHPVALRRWYRERIAHIPGGLGKW